MGQGGVQGWVREDRRGGGCLLLRYDALTHPAADTVETIRELKFHLVSLSLSLSLSHTHTHTHTSIYSGRSSIGLSQALTTERSLAWS